MRWLDTPQKLSREQLRVLREAARHGEPIAISGITLLEIAVLSGRRSLREIPFDKLIDKLRSSPTVQILPLTLEIATEVTAIGDGMDPADRAIVATARVHQLRLITSDEGIIDSGLVPVVT